MFPIRGYNEKPSHTEVIRCRIVAYSSIAYIRVEIVFIQGIVVSLEEISRSIDLFHQCEAWGII